MAGIDGRKLRGLRSKYEKGKISTAVIALEYGVSTQWIYHHCADLTAAHKVNVMYHSRGGGSQVPLDLKKMSLKEPHMILYLMASGQLSDEQVREIGIRSTTLEDELRTASDGKTLEEVVRDHPLLMLRTMLRLETYAPGLRERGSRAELYDGPSADDYYDPMVEAG